MATCMLKFYPSSDNFRPIGRGPQIEHNRHQPVEHPLIINTPKEAP